MKTTAKNALELARLFQDAAIALFDYRLDNWDSISKPQRATIENAAWTLLNNAADFVTRAVGIIIDDAQGGLKRLTDVTAKANKTVKRINEVKKIILIGSALIKFGAAIITRDPKTIASAVGELDNLVS